MSDDLFAEVKSEGDALDIDKAFERLETKGETPVGSQSTNEEEVEPSQGGESEKNNTPEEQIPFHKHPRWIKQQEELKETREKLAKIESERAQSQPVQIPKWYTDRYGDTDEAKANYQAIVQKDGELDWLKQAIKDDLKQETQAEQSQTQAGEEYVDTQLSEMSDEGLKFEKNVLLKFMVEFQEEFGAGALLDKDGNYDFRKSLSLMERLNPPEVDTSTVVKKQVASVGTRGKASTERPTNIPVLSRSSLRRGNWRDAETGQFVKS